MPWRRTLTDVLKAFVALGWLGFGWMTLRVIGLGASDQPLAGGAQTWTMRVADLAAMTAIAVAITGTALMRRGSRVGGAFAAGGPEELDWLVRQGLDSTTAGVVVADAVHEDGPIVYANKAFSAITGYTAEEAIGRNPKFLHGPDTDQATVDQLRRDIDAGNTSICRILNYRKDGTTFWNDLRVSPVRGKDGSIRYYVGILVDATAEVIRDGGLNDVRAVLERRVAERTAALEASQAHLRGVLDNIADMIVTIDDRGRITAVNATATQILGWTQEELIGRDVSILATEPDRSHHPEYIARYNKTGQSRILGVKARELTAVRKDGTPLPIELTIGEMKTAHGGTVFVGVMRDISARRAAEEEIEKTRSRLSDVVGSANEAIALFDAEERMTLFNASFRKVFSALSKDLRIGLRLGDLLSAAIESGAIDTEGETKAAFLADRLARHLRADGRPVQYRLQGSRWLQISTKPSQDGGIVIVGTDITALVQERERALASERKLARAQEIAHIGSWETGLTNYTLTWSDETYRMCGLDPAKDQITFTAFLAMVHPDDYQDMRSIPNAALDAGRSSYTHTHRIIRADGAIRQTRVNGEIVRDETGKPIRIVGTTQDITDQVLMEQALRRTADELKLITDNLPMMVTYLDKDERYRFANRRATEWMNRPIDAIIGAHIGDVLTPEAYEKIRPRMLRALAGEAMHYRETVTHPNGVTARIDVQYVPHRLDDGSIAGYFAVIADVTQQEALEAQLRQAQKMEVVGQLTGGIAHDFNNFLGVILGNLDLAVPLVDDRPRVATLVGRAIGAAERAAAVTRRLMAFSRSQPLAHEVVDIRSALNGVLELVRQSVGAAIRVALKVEEDLWPCSLDRAELESVIMNLSINARDAMPDGGTITISASNVSRTEDGASPYPDAPAGQFIEIGVTDTGKGMSTETAQRIFEPFFTTKEVGKGTGLGLSMVHGFVHQSGGFIAVDSTPGSGTTIRFILPRHAADDATPDSLRLAAGDHPNPALIGADRLVLVVEDDAEMRDFAVAVFRQLGFRTLEAGDAVGAMAAITADPGIALVFSDIMLPGGQSGIDLASLIRQQRPDLPVLLNSGFTGVDAEAVRHLIGTGRLLFKPFRVQDLVAKLGPLLEESQS